MMAKQNRNKKLTVVLLWLACACALHVGRGDGSNVQFPSPPELDNVIARHHHALVLVGLEKGCPKCNILLSELERVRLRGVGGLSLIHI